MSNDLPEGTSVEITPGTVAGGVVVNPLGAEPEPEPEYKVLHEVWVAGKLYKRVQYPDGHSKLLPA